MMSFVPWSSKDPKTNLLDTDEFMMLVPTEAAAADKNQRITVSDVKQVLAPIATQTIHVLNQADLELSILGTNLELPDDTILKIIIDDDFTVTKPFKLGNDSLLEIVGGRVGLTITYTGTGAFFQNTIPGTDDADDLIIKDIDLEGDDTNDLFNVEVSSVSLDTVTIRDFKNLGVIDPNSFKFRDIRTISTEGMGLVLKNAVSVAVQGWTIANFSTTGITALSYLYASIPFTPPTINLNDFLAMVGAGDSMLYLDPTFTDVSYVITNSPFPGGGGDFYQQGSIIPITAVADNGSGKIRCTSVAHGLPDGKVVALGEFFAQTTYNATVIITLIDANTFDAEAIDFLGNDSGEFDAESLTQTDIRVTGFNNPNQPDSMFTGDAGLEVFAVPIVSSSLAQDAFEIIISASWAYNNLERFVIGVNNEGQLGAFDPATRRYKVDYSATLEKSGGGSLDIGIVILKNGSIISFNAPHTVNSGLIQITGSDIIELAQGDLIQIAVINYNVSAAVIETSQVNMVVNRA